MSKDNEIKSEKNSSTIKNLFRQSESPENSGGAASGPVVSDDYASSGRDKSSEGFFGRIKSLIGSMKQNPENEDDDEEAADNAPEKKRGFIQMLRIESYDDSPSRPAQTKPVNVHREPKPEPVQIEQPQEPVFVPEQPEIFSAPEPKPEPIQIEQPQEPVFVPEQTEVFSAPEPKPEPVQIEQPQEPVFVSEQTEAFSAPETEQTQQPEEISTEPESIQNNELSAEQPEYVRNPDNVIYSSPVKAEKKPVPDTPVEKPSNDRMKKELPAFDIFEEFAKEQQKKNNKDTKEISKTETYSAAPAEEKAPEQKKPVEAPSEPSAPEEKTTQNDKAASDEHKPQNGSDISPSKKDNKKIIQLGLPNNEGTSTDNIIYDGDPDDVKAVKRDLTEGYVTSVRYHYSTAVPIIVMAGKFSKTLRTEYEAVRVYRLTGSLSSSAQKNAARSAEKLPSKQPSSTAQKPSAEAPAPKNQEAPKTPPAAAPVSPTKAVRTSVPADRGKSVTIPLKSSKPPVRQKPSEPMALKDVINPAPPAAEEKPPVREPKKRAALKSEKHKAAKAGKEKKKFRIGYLFNSEEDYDPDDDVNRVVVPKPMIDDYNEESDAEAISTEISTNFQAVFARTIVLLATSVASLVLALLGQCTSLFSETIRNGWLWFALIGFVFFAVSVFVSRSPILNGLAPLKRFKGNSDTAVAVACVAAAMQSFTAMFTPDVYLNGRFYIYTSLVTLALLCNSLGKLLIITRTHYNFSFLTKPYPKYAGKIYTDKTNAEKMSAELPIHRPIIGYTKRSKFMSNFLQLSYAPDPSEELAAAIAPWTALFSVICGLVYGLLNLSFLGGLASFALTAFMSVPIISLLAVNIPLRGLCKNSLKGGAMVTSYETVKQFCDTNAVMIDSSQLYPKGSVTLSGMKSFKQSKLNEALLSGAAIMYAVNGTLLHVFENIVQCSKEQLPKVENVIYEDGRGLVGWVNGQRVLIGNRELLSSHNIEPPEIGVEQKYLAMGNEITYISVSGDLIAMFILSYKTNKNVAIQLKKLEQDGVCFVVRTIDANLTREMVAKNFGLFYRCITILPTNLGNICHETMTSVDERSRAYLVTRGKLSSFARAVSGCIRIKSNVTISRLLQCVGMGMGLAIVTLISFVSGFEKLGCLEMLIYTSFWSVTTIIATLIRK